MFKYKTQTELSAMTETEMETYATEKRAHEAKVQKEAIAEATKGIDKLPETVKQEVIMALEALKAEGISKEQINEFKEQIAQLKEANSGSSLPANFLGLVEKALTEALPTLKEMKAGARKGQELEFEIKAAIPVITTSVANAGGVVTPDAAIYGMGLVYSTDVRKEQYIINFLSNGTTNKASLPYADKLPNQGTMAITAEGALKPLISVTVALRYSTAIKIAGRSKVSEEALDDISFLMSLIQNELKYEHDIAEQTAIFAKVAAIAPGFVAGGMAASTTAPSNFDAIRAAIYAVKIASKGRYIPNAVLVPSSDAYNMGATKDTQNNYVLPTFVLPDGTKISGVQVIEVADGETVANGSFIVGDWRKLHRLIYKSFNIRIGQGINGDAVAANIVSDFESNMYTVIGESRLHLWIYENEKTAFIKTTFAAVKTAIAAS